MPLDSLKKEDLHPDDDVAMEEHLPEREGETRDMQSDFFTRNSAFMTSFDNVSVGIYGIFLASLAKVLHRLPGYQTILADLRYVQFICNSCEIHV